MVDQVSAGQSSSISQLQANQLQQNQQIEQLNQQASAAQQTELNPFLDRPEISQEAKAKIAAEKDLSRFAQLASRIPESYNAEKVTQLKSLVDANKVSDYLRNFSNSDLAQSLLNDPIAANFR